MKIISLRAENIKRLTAVEITPDGNLIQITGKNGQGKTSVLDAIWWCLSGASNIQTTPIRDGEERALITLDLGQYIVNRTFSPKEEGGFTTTLKVTTPDGARFNSPQAVLDKLFGELTFDPLHFTRMKPQEQIAALQSLAPDFDFEQNEIEIQAAYDERRIVNRQLSAANTTAHEMSQGLPETPPAYVDPAQAMHELSEANEFNAAIQRRKTNREKLVAKRDEIAAQIAKLQDELDDAESTIAGFGGLPEPKDITAMKAKFDGLSHQNDIARKAEVAAKAKQEAERFQSESDALTKTIEDKRAAAKKAIAEAKIPVDGMGFSEDGVTLDGLPFSQASDAQQLHASIAVAMALNPNLKVIRVRDGSLLDSDAMVTLAKLADDHGYQVWIEKVDDSGEVGFVIEDGRVKGQSIEPTPIEPAKKSKAKKSAPSDDGPATFF